MSKVRVYELAKQYGMKGPDLAKLLNELGFEKVKSHMAVLDDATELHARAVMEAQGLARVSEAAATKVATEPGRPRKKALPSSGDAVEAPRKKELPGLKTLPSKKTLPPPVKKPAKKKLPDEGVVKTGTGVTSSPATEEAAEVAAEPLEVAPELEATAAQEAEAPVETPAPAAAEAVEAETPVAETPSAETPAPEVAATTPAEATAPATPTPAPPPATPEAPTPEAVEPEPAAAEAEPSTPAEAPPSAAPETPEQAPTAEPAPQGKDVKRLLVPQAKAKILGRIELPAEAIKDAKRRSAPGGAPGGRNPGGVDRNLRRAALRSTQSRTASRTGGRGGLGMRRGPGMGPGGRRGPGRGGRKSSTTGSLSSTVDPNKIIEIEPPITVKGLSEAIGVKVNDLIAALTFKLGVIGKNINSFLSNDEVELVALEVKRNIKLVERKEAEEELLQTLVKAAEDIDTEQRAPVVTFMGHVDHGKTSLLDAFRTSDVVRGEAGGITQHVGAYKVRWQDGHSFVVLDTPGHEAFTQMRARGAKLTDIVVLVVAADDGVMPQTEEAIAHAKDAGVPIVVAINKCDRPNANPMQVRQQLAVKGLQPEDWGGDVQVVEVSAITKQGLDDLVERLMLQAEILELAAKPDAPGEAVVIESKQTPEQGVTVSVLVTSGTLRLRDQVLCGESLSRVRGIVNDLGENLKEAGPSTPVALLGLTTLPLPGDKLYVVNDKKKAKEVVEDRQRHARNLSLAERSKVTAENLRAQLQAQQVEELKLILRADVSGSLEPIRTSLARLNTDEVRINVIQAALGGITETDVSLAQASGAMIIGFNAVADPSARQAADRAGVEIRFYEIIYELLDDMKLALEGRLKPEEVEEALGHAEIRAVFRSSRFGNIAGCYIEEGLVRRGSNVRLVRDGKIVYTGQIASLRREKDDAREVKGGYECGLTLKDFNDIKEGDRLDFYEIKFVKRTLD